MTDIDIKKSGKTAVVRINGELGIACANELQKAIIKAFRSCRKVTIEAENIEGFDLSSLQLFCAAHKMAIDLNKELTFNCEPPLVLSETATSAGYSNRTGCSVDNKHRCLWLKE